MQEPRSEAPGRGRRRCARCSRSIAGELDSTPGSVEMTMHKCRKKAVDAYGAITEER